LWIKSFLVVLRDEPRLERREEQRRGNASEHAPNHQDLVLGGVLGEAAQDVGDAVGDARPLPPLLICEGSDDGAEEHGGAEAGDEEAADVALVEAVLAVEVVHVGPLQPVPRHHEGVDEDVVVLEGVEGRGGGDAVLAGLAELQRRHDGGERAEHEVVERLHGVAVRGGEIASGGKGEG